ncbi:alpha/beta hydrolase [Streptomyces iconiensis]|uniref:Alpha/beta hydrolase n=1 Tax=Streptomyces iconiensis TaxID=1384038 RepID=A0ABT6ZU45_9ACTN|nr:alpha/beta hydrolase [Streptomyces iconiensis]MDJ1132161.1 alpha/beta hydrolase [Streptomyces iconiensis]
MSSPAARASFLLVHGAWHRPTCWNALRDLLAANGHRSRTVALPSTGPQGTPAAGMYDDAEEIAAHLRQMDGPVVLVAHSYAGLPATQLPTDQGNLAHLVYLSAYMPAEGESLNSIHGAPTPEDEDLTGTHPSIFDNPRVALYAELPDDQAEDAIGQLVGQSNRSFQQQVTRAAWRTVPSTYVLCTRDRAMPPALQEQMSGHASAVERLDAGHSAFLTAPAELAALLGGIASGITGN